MELLIGVLCVIVGLFAFVVLFGAPYVPTLQPQIKTALDLLALKPGQTLLEIGSGDGRVLKAAAERGLYAVGYELNPLLVFISRWRTRKYRGKVRVVWGNGLARAWPPADGIYVFGVSRIMPKLYTKIMQYPHKPIGVTSFGFELPDAKMVRQKQGVFLYRFS